MQQGKMLKTKEFVVKNVEMIIQENRDVGIITMFGSFW
jgi:hypothetical protein